MIFRKKPFSFVKTIFYVLFIVSLFSCNNIFNNEIKQTVKPEQKPEVPEVPASSEKTEWTLVVTPQFNSDNQKNSRSAYPGFSNEQIKDFIYLISSSEFTETEGVFDNDNGKITFTINSLSFTNKEIKIFAAKQDSENVLQKLWIAKTKITYALGDTKEISVNFVPYTEDEGNTEELSNGAIDLIVETTSEYSVSCVIESTGSTPEQVSGYGKPVQVSSVQTNKCTIKTETNGIAPGSYTAKIQIKKNGELREYIIQTIVVWPGITTDTWYLPDGNKSNTYTVTISENEKRIYVCGSNPKGLYNTSDGLASYMTISPSDTNSGSITQPYASISTAINKTLNNSGYKYTIICDGDFEGFTLTSSGARNLRDITIKGGGNSNNYSSITSTITLYTQANIIFENLKFSNLSDSYSIQGNFYDSKELILNNCIIENNASSHTGILCASRAIESVPKLLLNDTKITCTSGTALQFDTDSSTQSELTIKGSTYIQPTSDSKNQMEVYALTKMIIDGALTDSHQILGTIKFLSDIAVDTQFMTAENSANLAIESQRFEVIDYPKIINTEGKIAYAKDFYVASDTSTPAGSSYGNGSSKNPLNKVSAAVAKIKTVANTENCAGKYTIHVSGTIKESSIITVSAGTDTDTLGVFTGSKLKITGTDNTTDKLDGNENHNVLSVSGTLNLTITNLTIQKGNSATGGGLNITSGANVVLEDGVLITENTASQKGGGVYIYGSKSKMTMNPGSLITKNYISATTNGDYEYGGGGVYIGAYTYSDTNSPELILNGGEISEHSLAYEMRGAGVIVSYAKLTINSGKITKNKATDIAANVMLQNNSKMTMTGGEISYGEINGTADASAAGVWINGTTSMTMSGGKICNNTVKAASTKIGRGAGVTAWQTGSTFIMTGGEISENKVDTTYSNNIQGGALCVYTTANCYFSGDIKIPYGVNGTEGKGLNDVWIYNNNKITITGKLSTPDSGKIGAISPQSYTEGKVLLEVADDASPATTIEDECGKFTLVQPESGSEKWLLLKSGKLRKEVQDDYITANAVSETTLTSQLTMNGVSGTESSLFIAGRTISIPKMIVSDHELTQKEYLEYCYYAHTAAYKKPGLSTWTVDGVTYSAPVGDNYPATYVSWYDAIVYCNLRSIDEGLTPAYSIGGKTNPAEWESIEKGSGTDDGKYCGPLGYTDNWNSISFDTSANGWRMPTELEWEYLARGGTLDATDEILVDSTNYNTYAWVKENTSTHVCHEVKQLTANKLGLYDIFGNVYEYVWDWSGDVDQTTALTGRTSSPLNKRMVRGGGMKYEYTRANPFDRTVSNDPEMRWENCGVRIVRNAD